MQDATENCHYPELVGESLRMEPITTFLENTLQNSLYWGNECLWLQLTSLVLLERISKGDNTSLQQTINHIPRYNNQVSLPWFHSLRLCSNSDNDTFAIINMQTSHTQGKIWAMIGKFCLEMFFADPFGSKVHRFVKQNYKHVMPTKLQCHPSDCCFPTIFAVFITSSSVIKELLEFKILGYSVS